MCTGIGLTAALPIISQLHTSGREIFLIWITRTVEQIAFNLPNVLNCTATLIFYSGKEKEREVRKLDAIQSKLASDFANVRVRAAHLSTLEHGESLSAPWRTLAHELACHSRTPLHARAPTHSCTRGDPT